MRDHSNRASRLPPEPGTPQARPVRLRAFDGEQADERDDLVACEEPLEIQLGPASLAVVMRTPGHDEELALGFMITERIVASPSDIVSIRHCSTSVTPEAEDNVIRVVLAPSVEVDLAALRRNLFASSSCGICGKATIENALATAPPLTGDTSNFAAAVIRTFADRLGEGQDVFRSTGGLHAAALFDRRGDLLVVQKALAARIPLVAAVSAPTSLAIELAAASGITLVGFLRGETMNVYTNPSRVGA